MPPAIISGALKSHIKQENRGGGGGHTWPPPPPRFSSPQLFLQDLFARLALIGWPLSHCASTLWYAPGDNWCLLCMDVDVQIDMTMMMGAQ